MHVQVTRLAKPHAANNARDVHLADFVAGGAIAAIGPRGGGLSHSMMPRMLRGGGASCICCRGA